MAKEGILKQDGLLFLKPMDYQTRVAAVPRAIAENTDQDDFDSGRKSKGNWKQDSRWTTAKTETVVFKKYTDWT